jgi:hypothetical protein
MLDRPNLASRDKYQVSRVDGLHSAMEREKAPMGVFSPR